MTGAMAARGDRALRSDHGQGVGEEGEAHGVVEVGVAQHGVGDGGLLGDGESASDGARVHQDVVVDEEGRRSLALPVTAVGPEHLEPHSTCPSFPSPAGGISQTLV